AAGERDGGGAAAAALDIDHEHAAVQAAQELSNAQLAPHHLARALAAHLERSRAPGDPALEHQKLAQRTYAERRHQVGQLLRAAAHGPSKIAAAVGPAVAEGRRGRSPQ